MALEGILNISYIVSLLISSLVAFIAIVIISKVIAKEINIKHALIMSVVALFITPILFGYLIGYISFIPSEISVYLMPLVVWIILGQLLLSSDFKAKLKVAVIAFVAYYILSIYVTPQLQQLISGFIP